MIKQKGWDHKDVTAQLNAINISEDNEKYYRKLKLLASVAFKKPCVEKEFTKGYNTWDTKTNLPRNFMMQKINTDILEKMSDEQIREAFDQIIPVSNDDGADTDYTDNVGKQKEYLKAMPDNVMLFLTTGPRADDPDQCWLRVIFWRGGDFNKSHHAYVHPYFLKFSENEDAYASFCKIHGISPLPVNKAKAATSNEIAEMKAAGDAMMALLEPEKEIMDINGDGKYHSPGSSAYRRVVEKTPILSPGQECVWSELEYDGDGELKRTRKHQTLTDLGKCILIKGALEGECFGVWFEYINPGGELKTGGDLSPFYLEEIIGTTPKEYKDALDAISNQIWNVKIHEDAHHLAAIINKIENVVDQSGGYVMRTSEDRPVKIVNGSQDELVTISTNKRVLIVNTNASGATPESLEEKRAALKASLQGASGDPKTNSEYELECIEYEINKIKFFQILYEEVEGSEIRGNTWNQLHYTSEWGNLVDDVDNGTHGVDYFNVVITDNYFKVGEIARVNNDKEDVFCIIMEEKGSGGGASDHRVIKTVNDSTWEVAVGTLLEVNAEEKALVPHKDKLDKLQKEIMDEQKEDAESKEVLQVEDGGLVTWRDLSKKPDTVSEYGLRHDKGAVEGAAEDIIPVLWGTEGSQNKWDTTVIQVAARDLNVHDDTEMKDALSKEMNPNKWFVGQFGGADLGKIITFKDESLEEWNKVGLGDDGGEDEGDESDDDDESDDGEETIMDYLIAGYYEDPPNLITKFLLLPVRKLQNITGAEKDDDDNWIDDFSNPIQVPKGYVSGGSPPFDHWFPAEAAEAKCVTIDRRMGGGLRVIGDSEKFKQITLRSYDEWIQTRNNGSQNVFGLVDYGDTEKGSVDYGTLLRYARSILKYFENPGIYDAVARDTRTEWTRLV
jgi:hypothetical protein